MGSGSISAMIRMQAPPPVMEGEIKWDVTFYKEFGGSLER
jgi:hypothetical protein